jgi:hypothetical protein
VCSIRKFIDIKNFSVYDKKANSSDCRREWILGTGYFSPHKGQEIVVWLFLMPKESILCMGERGGWKNGTGIYERKASIAVGTVNVAADDFINDGGVFVQYY